MKERVLLQGVVSEVSFPCKGKLMPTEDQPPVLESDPAAGILYVAPQKTYGPMEVKNLLPGQKWLVTTGTKGKRSRECHPLMMVERAPYEIGAVCPHAETCGGCLYQTVPYEMQAEWKEAQVKKLLSVVEGMDDCEWIPIKKSPITLEYRNKMEYSFGDEVKGGPLTLGLHKRGAFHDIIETPECKLVHEDLRKILKATLDYFREEGAAPYNTYSGSGFLRHLVLRRSYMNGEVLVNLVTTSGKNMLKKDGFPMEKSAEELVDGWKEVMKTAATEGEIAGILHTVNDSVADTVQADQLEILEGKAELIEELHGLKFRIFPFSFFQTNSLGAEELYGIVKEFAGDVSSEEVFDLYCGTGTIAQIMASAGAAKVSGIEIVSEAVDAARENASMNGLDNCHFICGDVLKEIENLKGTPDLIILDPPRDGCHPKALPKLLAFAPKRFIYVSCKPTSLVRDLPMFIEAGYHVDKIRTCDMFPMTPHVESVVLLSKQDQLTAELLGG